MDICRSLKETHEKGWNRRSTHIRLQPSKPQIESKFSTGMTQIVSTTEKPDKTEKFVIARLVAVFVVVVLPAGMEKILLLISLLYSKGVNRFFLSLFIHGRGEEILLLRSSCFHCRMRCKVLNRIACLSYSIINVSLSTV
jgi:hypothetical protein